jgi:hypothetical protein
MGLMIDQINLEAVIVYARSSKLFSKLTILILPTFHVC